MKLGKCPICGGKTAIRQVDVTEPVGKRLVVIEKVDAEVCSQCGERLYSETTMRKLDLLLQRVKSGSAKAESKREVQVYALGR